MMTTEPHSQPNIPVTASPGVPRWRFQPRWLFLPISLLAGLAVWEWLVRVNEFPPFILPRPTLVWERFLTVWADGTLWRHVQVTLAEVAGGLALGFATASLLGYLIAKSHAAERVLTPYIIASQSIPVVAIAPLLVIWFRTGLLSKVVIGALIVFFPILINTIIGLRSVEQDLRDLMRSLKATRWQTFLKLEVPAALPVLLGGLKIGATLSVIGAVVGEFVGSDRGLGFLINLGRGQYDTALVFVAVAVLVILAMGLYGAVTLLEKYFLAWKR